MKDEPNIRLRCSRNLKIVLPMKNTSRVSTQHVSVCTFKTSPRVHSKRPRVCWHHAHMLKHVCAWCRNTRSRFECTRRDVLSGHAETCSVHTHHTPHGDRDRERRQKKRDREKRRRKRRRQDKRREKIHFQCGGAWPFFIVGVLFLVNPVCERDLCLLNSTSWPVNIF